MNGITILIWITIAIIGVIAIIVVRLHYGGKQLENDEGSILEDAGSITKLFSESQNKLSKNENKSKPAQLNKSKSSSFKSKILHLVMYLKNLNLLKLKMTIIKMLNTNLKIRYWLIMIILLKNFKNQLNKARWILWPKITNLQLKSMN